jgi:hypothetical protein
VGPIAPARRHALLGLEGRDRPRHRTCLRGHPTVVQQLSSSRHRATGDRPASGTSRGHVR